MTVKLAANSPLQLPIQDVDVLAPARLGVGLCDNLLGGLVRQQVVLPGCPLLLNLLDLIITCRFIYFPQNNLLGFGALSGISRRLDFERVECKSKIGQLSAVLQGKL